MMMSQLFSNPEPVNVLIGNAHWPWPQAVEEIFRPRGINALLANTSNDMVRIIDNNKIHMAILDDAFDELSGLQTLKIIRKRNEKLPCILLAQKIDNRLLSEALVLNVFSVVNKPVDIPLLSNQIHRLFLKHYHSNMFNCTENDESETDLSQNSSCGSELDLTINQTKARFSFRWSMRKRR